MPQVALFLNKNYKAGMSKPESTAVSLLFLLCSPFLCVLSLSSLPQIVAVSVFLKSHVCFEVESSIIARRAYYQYEFY